MSHIKNPKKGVTKMTIREFLLINRKQILEETYISKQVLSGVINGKNKLSAKYVREMMIVFPEFGKIFVEDDENGLV